MIGKTLGHYEILSLLGKGGMGEVYLARDTKLGREVALKVLPAELAADPERHARFLREAKSVAARTWTCCAETPPLQSNAFARSSGSAPLGPRSG